MIVFKGGICMNDLPSSINKNVLDNHIANGEVQAIKYIRSTTGYGINEAKDILRKYMATNNLQFNIKSPPPRTSIGLICPRCHSSSVSTGARGTNGFWGFIGASKTVNRCGKCGYTWKP